MFKFKSKIKTLTCLTFQEIFKPTRSCYSGYGVGIFGAMDSQWNSFCSMIHDDDEAKSHMLPTEQETLCQRLHFCVCSGHGEECYHFHVQLTQVLKTYLKTIPKPREKKSDADAAGEQATPGPKPKPKPKPKPNKPVARLKAEAAFLVLRFRAVNLMFEPSESSACLAPFEPALEILSTPQMQQWNSFISRNVEESQAHPALPRDVFFHMGHMNYSSWHFAGIELEVRTQMDDGCFHCRVPQIHHFLRSLVFIDKRLDLSLPWAISLWEIRSTVEPVLAADMIPGQFLVDAFKAVPETQVWLGSSLERAKRSNLINARKKRDRQGQPSHHRSKKTPIPAGILDMYGEESIEKDLLAIGADDMEAENPDSGEEDIATSDSDGEENDVPNISEVLKSKAKSRTDKPFKFWQQKSSAKRATAKTMKGTDDSTPAPVSAVQSPPAPEASAPSSSASRIVTTHKTRSGTEVKFVLPDRFHGSLAYYPKSESMVAFCTKHAGDCRRSRTTKASATRPGQGRCVGSLISWLQLSHHYANKEEHVKFCLSTHQERLEARREFMSLPQSEEFSAYERALRDGEDAEPADIA